jgi:hypothetical protein
LRDKNPEVVEKLLKSKPPNHETLLHKMAARNPVSVKKLYHRMGREWPTITIPHICNSDGITPVKLAHQKRHRMVVGVLLDHLRNYPPGYCQVQIAEMASEFIKEKFEHRVGAYLNSRFYTPAWVQGYDIGRLVLTDQGINQTSINNWPAVTKNFEEKFFDKQAREVPTKLQLLDCPDIHTMSNEESNKLLLSLSLCDVMIFSNKSIQAIIEYKWEQAKPAIVKWLLIPFVCYLITFQVYVEFLF